MKSREGLIRATVVGYLLGLALPILGIAFAAFFFPQVQWVNIPVHSLMEACGGLMALAIAGILLAEHERPERGTSDYWLATGLFGMGVLDLWHAAVSPGNTFVWLRSTATLVGGVSFAGTWWPETRSRHWLSRLPWMMLAAVMVFGVLSVVGESYIPRMTDNGKRFTSAAWLLNAVGGIGFFAAAVFFAKRFRESGSQEAWLFGVQSLLLGASGLLFEFSRLWDAAWWWWHLLRLVAYGAALVYGVQSYLRASQEVLGLNQRLHEMNAGLDQLVESRTSALKISEERFELAVRGSTDGLWDWDISTNNVYFSPRLFELLGFADGEIPSLFATFEKHLHPDDHDWVLQAVQRHLQERVPYDVEYRLRLKSGDYRWFRARGQALWNASGQAYRMCGSITDVTAEHALRERFRLAIAAAPMALLMVHRDGRIALLNQKTLELFGYSEEELLGKPIELLVPERFREGHPDNRNRFFTQSEIRPMGANLDLFGRRRDGREFPVRVGLSPIQSDDGLAVICGVVDISEQVEALKAMQTAKEAAESANRAKSSFLANMSHEIRTPMNGILGMSQLLARTNLRSTQRDYLNSINTSADNLLRLLNDILDFSKIEAGRLQLERIDFRLSECVGRATQMVSLKAAEQGLEFACRIAPEIPDRLIGDPGRLQQVLVNLLSNAIKFTKAGEVYLNVETDWADDSELRLHCSVRDTGIGIPRDKQELLFQPFEQGEAETTRRFGGTGLGLAISRQLVEMMHGRMWLESDVGQGSTFHFVVPLQISESQEEPETATLAGLIGLRVLVVDDNSTNRSILNEMLTHWGMQPVLANSAESARQQLLKAAANDARVRLILLDHAMPGEDGFQFVASLPQVGYANCPVIMISSGSDPGSIEHSEAVGVAKLMTKPIIASDLLNEILEVFGRSDTASESGGLGSSTSRSAQPRRVLLVEDNEINRRVAFGLLHERGHRVSFAINGQEAIDLLTREEFDVVLMDMQMPVLDGYAATRVIRERERTSGQHLPIVAMTAEALKGDRERCLASGMDDYVSKPISPTELFRAVERFPATVLAGLPAVSVPDNAPAQSDLTIGEQGAVVTAESKPRQQTSPTDEEIAPPLDWNIARHRIPGGDSMLRDFVEMFRSQAIDLMQQIRDSLQTGNATLLRRSAHTLRGSAMYFGATPTFDAAARLEAFARENQLAAAADAAPELERELNRLLEALNDGHGESRK